MRRFVEAFNSAAAPPSPQEMGEKLLSLLMKPQLLDEGEQASCLSLIERGAALTVGNQWGQTPLWLAARQGEDVVLRALLGQCDDNIEEPCHSGWTPLIISSSRNRAGAVELLLEAGADISAADTHQGKETALFHALKGTGGDVAICDTVALLLAKNSDLGIKNKYGQTVLEVAEEEAVGDVVKTMIREHIFLKEAEAGTKRKRKIRRRQGLGTGVGA